MTNDKDDLIEILPDGVECPTGRITFGALISEQQNKDLPKQQLSKREKAHLNKYSRWLKTLSRRLQAVYPKGHPVHHDIRHYELHVTELLKFASDAVCVEWFFNTLTDKDRRNLVEVTHGADPEENGGLMF